MAKTLEKTVARKPKPETEPPKSTTPKPFEAVCIVARHFCGKPAAWLEMRKLLDRVSHNWPPERYHEDFKSILALGK